jgi:orotidine-5'-phosphate decarboxylase
MAAFVFSESDPRARLKRMQVETPAATKTFSDRVAEAVEHKRSQLVVGLDPRLDLLPVELRGDAHVARSAAADAVARFCCGIVDAVAPYAVAVKPQLAFFEALGSDGVRAFEQTCGYSRSAGLLVIADAKRGDIGSTARAYAAAYLEGETPVADALTVNPYLGRDSLDPFFSACRRHGGGVFCLVKTSNEGGGDVQDVRLSDGGLLWQHVARLVSEWGEDLIGEHGLSSVGAVVGATHSRAVSEARRLLPRSILLLPGVGAQGASPGDVARAFTSGPASALVAASRSITYGFRSSGEDWRTGASQEAARLKTEIWAASGW